MTDNESLPGLPESIDVPAADIEKLAGIPLRAQQIGALLSIGFTPPDIDQAFTLPEGTARAYRGKYFTDKSINLSPQTRDKLLAAYIRSKAVGLVSGITPAKIQRAGVGELAKSSAMLLARAESLEGAAQAEDIGAKVSNALSKLAQLASNKRIASNDKPGSVDGA